MTTTASPWTSEDRALMLALNMYRRTLCPGCGEPKDLAWHPENDGWYDAPSLTCHACTAIAQADDPQAKPTRHHIPEYTRGPSSRQLKKTFDEAIQEVLEDQT